MAGEADSPPRPLRFRIVEATRAVRKPQYVLEKDYALSYLLACVSAVPELFEGLVFKGGTCLRKAYFPGYRFSEDLDYTARTKWSCTDLLAALGRAVEEMRALLLEHGPLEVMISQEEYREPHPRGQCAFKVRVQFPWMRTASCTLKVEVSMEEPLLTNSIERRLIHEFSGEALGAMLPTYQLDEIAAEKLRAFLQARQHLRDRGWLRNRPRDLYDIWHLHEQQDFPIHWRQVGHLLLGKAEAYALTYSRPEDFLDGRVLQGIERDWEAQLTNFVIGLPAFDQCVGVFRALVEEVFP